jgi:serine-type D-Ala-D-Ala carboxypeptidase/endopeptidase (penicillin-binding protein 4)
MVPNKPEERTIIMSKEPRHHGGMLNGRALFTAFALSLFVASLLASASIAQASQSQPVAQAKSKAPASGKAPAPRRKGAGHRRAAGQTPTFDEGVLIQSLSGTTLVSVNEAKPTFNPASNTKLATSLAVLRKFGPAYTFQTEVRADGQVNDKGELQGDLYVDGQYMLFGDRQARELVEILTKRGIVSVTGDIYVSPNFSMNLEVSGLPAGKLLLKILDPWYGRKHQGVNLHAAQPQVQILGGLKVGTPPATSTLIVEHTSPPLKDILKVMLCYSDNKMAELFGDMIGGPKALTEFVITELGVSPDEVHFATTSGLDINRISPRAMMKVLRALRAELATHNLELPDILAVAGIDDGTLKKRFTEPNFKGTVIGKTGTLTETDQGVAALSGEMHTVGEDAFLFVIFEEHGDVDGFRTRQDKMVKKFLDDHSGPKAITYTPILDRVDHEDFWK